MKSELIGIHRAGIDFHHVRYHSKELTKFYRNFLSKRSNEKMVAIRYNPTDLSKLFVYDEPNQQYIVAYAVDSKSKHNTETLKDSIANARAKIESLIREEIGKQWSAEPTSRHKTTSISKCKGIDRLDC
jgi:hypothetical protein